MSIAIVQYAGLLFGLIVLLHFVDPFLCVLFSGGWAGSLARFITQGHYSGSLARFVVEPAGLLRLRARSRSSKALLRSIPQR